MRQNEISFIEIRRRFKKRSNFNIQTFDKFVVCPGMFRFIRPHSLHLRIREVVYVECKRVLKIFLMCVRCMWRFRCSKRLNLVEQMSHSKSFPLLSCVSMCCVSPLCCLNPHKQTSHVKGFSFEWMRSCSVKLYFCVKADGHKVHWYRFGFKWIFICRVKPFFSWKLAGHTSQVYGLSFEWVDKWSCNIPSCLNVAKQTPHL